MVKSYYELLVSGHQTLQTRDALRARLEAHPEGGTETLKDAAKLFYIFQQQGQLDAAKAVLAGYRTRKDARGAAWTAEELYTFGQLLEAVQDFPEAARYYYALAAEKKTPDAEQKGTGGADTHSAHCAEQPLRVGAGNLALYKNIATMDRGPGYLNGILSLFLNSQEPAAEYSSEDQLAVPYFHRAKAAELLAEIDKRFPNAPERAELHARLMDAYAAYGENNAVIREGTAFLAQFPADSRRVEVALEVGGRLQPNRSDGEGVCSLRTLLKELAAKADGVPLGAPGARRSASRRRDDNPLAACQRPKEYAQVLDRYLSRLVAMDRLPDALARVCAENLIATRRTQGFMKSWHVSRTEPPECS